MAEIKAIVYESNTGNTRRYAEMLSDILQIPVFSTIDNSALFGKRDEVIFLGWICAGKINGLRLAKVKYNPVIIVGVGMMPPKNEYVLDIKMQNNIDESFFYLQAGVNPQRLKGFYKLMFKALTRSLLRKAEGGYSQLSESDKSLVDIIKNGESFVSKENLSEIVKKYKELTSN